MLEYLKDQILEPVDISNGVLYALGTPPHVQVYNFAVMAKISAVIGINAGDDFFLDTRADNQTAWGEYLENYI